MESVKNTLQKLVLDSKRESLISALIPVVTGVEVAYQPGVPNPGYYEIWFYYPFDFQYVVIGWKNYTVKVSDPQDRQAIDEAFQEFKLDYSGEIEAEDDFRKFQHGLEFSFFSDCWAELENRIGKKLRCFLIEHGIMRGIDVNKGERIMAENIKEMLNKEGIPNHY